MTTIPDAPLTEPDVVPSGDPAPIPTDPVPTEPLPDSVPDPATEPQPGEDGVPLVP